jgi:2-polyprenyl-3-methyl-5-hydroxy-6-metoxy-1,4-benzoquinol methylase
MGNTTINFRSKMRSLTNNILEGPVMYKLSQTLLGKRNCRVRYYEKNIRAKSGDRILDIGCGPGLALDYLPSVEYVGFDLNSHYIKYAQAKYPNSTKFYCEVVGPNIQLEPNHFDIVMANGVLHHLSDEDAIHLMKLAFDALKPGGRLVTFDGCFEENQNKIAKYLLSQDRGEFVRDQQGYESLFAKVFSKYQTEIRRDILRLPYTHIIIEGTKV